MLEAKNISFRYGDDKPWVLHEVGLRVAPGKVVGLSGPSGRGKTTLAKILAGFLTPSAGRVSLNAAPLPTRGFCPVQLIFQNPELAVNPRWRIGQVLRESHDTQPDNDVLHQFGIEPGWLARWPHELSGGELQRIAVLRALGASTRFLICDEMTTMLDANTQAQIWQALVAHAAKQDIGLLIVSHDAPLLKRLCSRVVEMPAG